MGAFDNYQPPKPAPQSGGAFSNYQPPTPSAPPSNASSDIAQPDTLPALDPRTATAGDYLLKLHQAASGLGQIGQYGLDYARAAANVYGEGDSTLASLKALYGDITGPTIANVVKQQITGQGRNDLISNLAAERGKTAAAEERLGPPGRFAAGMTGAGPLASVAKGLGSTVAPYVGNWVGGVLGSGATSALATTAGEIGRGENISPRDIGLSTIVGALGGVPGGVVERGGELAPAMSEAALRARATQEYAPLDAMIFHGPSQIKPALDAVENTMTGAEKDLAKSTMAKVGKLGDQNLASGSDIQSYQKIFGRLAKTGSDADREFAPKFKSALEGVMNAEPYGRNLTPGQGMSLMLPGPLGGTGFAAGEAAAARNAGDVFHGRANDIRRLNDWIAESQVKGGGPDVGSQASSWLRSDTGKPFAKPGTPPYDALNTLAATAGTRQTSFAPSAFDLRHALYPIAGGAITGAGMGAAHGSDPGTIAEEALLGATMGYGLHVGVPAVYNKLVSIPGQQRAIDAARSTLSTGNYQAPVLPNANLRDALRTLIFGQGARGAY